jgi:signal transduction histidine kinase
MQARLIDDLLDMNRLTSGSVHLDMSRVEIRGLVQAALQGLQPAADAKDVQILAFVEQSIGEIFADARRIQQVLWNLVHNAIKFTPAGGRVYIKVHRVEHSLQMVVEDTGQGILPSFLPHVFERFRQQDASATRAASGLGLGLSIAKQLVELHGGTITVSSAGEGQGASFTVRVPAPPRKMLTASAEAPFDAASAGVS